METEIELKLLVNQEDHAALITFLNDHPQRINYYDAELVNIYFDTPEGLLRQTDCGLRVRSRDGHHEQTLKTRGLMVGGVYQRPEFNITIDGHRPELQLFPEHAWPDDLDPATLQEQLVSQFETNFRRRTWLLQFPDNSLVEVVLDVGTIHAADAEEPISELECELVKGDLQQLLELAHQFNTHFSVRLGGASKAARGYRLLKNEPIPETQPLKQLPLPHDADLGTLFEQVLNTGIGHLQYHEEAIHRGAGVRAWVELRNAVRLLEWGFSMFAGMLPESGDMFLPSLRDTLTKLQWVEQAAYREQLLRHKEQFMKRLGERRNIWRLIENDDQQQPEGMVEHWLSGADYNHWVLKLTGWLLSKNWYQQDSNAQWSQPAVELARQELTAAKQHLETLLPPGEEARMADYMAAQSALERSLMSSFCFRSLFDNDSENVNHGPWQDILRGCRELAMLDYLEQLISDTELTESQPLQRWFERKRGSWTEVLEHSRDAALEQPAYWQYE